MVEFNVNLNGKTILVTGAAGFIGSNLTLELLRTVENISIVGLDSVNDYYDVSIKEYRLAEIEKAKLSQILAQTGIATVVRLDAEAEEDDSLVAWIGEGAKLKNVILDKDVVVRPGAQLMGTPSNPVIVKRGEIV